MYFAYKVCFVLINILANFAQYLVFLYNYL